MKKKQENISEEGRLILFLPKLMIALAVFITIATFFIGENEFWMSRSSVVMWVVALMCRLYSHWEVYDSGRKLKEEYKKK